MRALLIALAGLAALVALALAIGPRFVDWNQFKPEIAALAERATGQTLTIDGDVGFAFLPTPTLSAAGVRLGAVPSGGGPGLMQLKSLDARIAFGPLLGGHVVVRSVVLVEPALVIDARSADTRRRDAALDDRLSFDHIIVVDGSVLWRDADGGEALRVERINAEISADAAEGPFRASGDVAWLGLPWRFELSSGRWGEAVPLSVLLGLRGGGATVRVTGTLALGAAETVMTGRVRAETKRLPELLAATGLANGWAARLPAPLGQAITLEAALQVGRARAALNDITLTVGDDMRAGGAVGVTLAAAPAFDATLAVNRLDVERWSTLTPLPARPAGAPAIAMPPLRGTIDLAIDAVSWRDGVIRQARLNGAFGDGGLTVRQAGAQLPGGADVSAFGQLTLGDAPRFDGRLEGGADNLRSLATWLRLDLGGVPPDRLRRVSVTSGLSVAPDRVELANMDLQFDSSRLTGSVTAALGARPAFGANLHLDRINLEAYLPRAALSAAAPFEWLTGFDANVELRVDQLGFDTLPLNGVVATLALERGELRVHELSVESAAGVRALVGGVVRRTQWPAEVDLTVTAQADDPSRFLQLVGDATASAALGSVALTATATGPLDHLRLMLDGELADGKIAATAEADALASTGKLDVTVSRVDLGRAADALIGVGGLAGTLDLSAALTASGPSSASLAGHGQAHVRAASMPGFDLDALNARVRAGAPAVDLAAITQDLSRGRTAFATLDGDVTVAGTRIQTDGMALASDAGSATLRGMVDLGARTLDLSWRLQLAAAAAAPSVSLQLSGSLTTPARTIEAQGLLDFLATRR